MIRYIWKKIVTALLLVLLVSFLVFILMQFLPGDPAVIALGDSASAEAIQEYRDTYGLDNPVLVQYLNWIKGIVFHWDFGKSILNARNVTAYMNERLPNTISIGLPGLVFGVLTGILVGILSAVKRGTWVDQGLTLIVNFFLGAPRFLVAIFGVIVLGLHFHLIPLQGYTAPWVNFGEYLHKAFWPVVVNAIYTTAILARQTRSNMLEVINQDFVRTARANGLSEGRIIFRYTLKNALIPVVTIIGLQMRNIVAGAVIIENVFNIPGIGQMLVSGVQQRDYFIVQGCVLIISMVTVFCNMFVDIAYGLIDPRVRKAMR
jgi:peptide/nickel transport system permease protein